MPIELLPSLLLSLIAVGYTPGPANIYSLSCVLTHGRKKAMQAWAGLLCGFLAAGLIATVAVHFVGMALGRYVVYVKYIGAAYILWLAWKAWHGAMAESGGVACTFWSGFLVQLTNAKMILFDLTVFSSFVLPYSSRFIDLLTALALLLIAGPGANLVWMLCGSLLRPFVVRYHKAVGIVIVLSLVACAVMIVL